MRSGTIAMETHRHGHNCNHGYNYQSGLQQTESDTVATVCTVYQSGLQHTESDTITTVNTLTTVS